MAQSESTSETEISSDSVSKLNENAESLSIRPVSSRSLTPYSSGHRQNWPQYSPIASTSTSIKGNELEPGHGSQRATFLHILFNREDLLLRVRKTGPVLADHGFLRGIDESGIHLDLETLEGSIAMDGTSIDESHNDDAHPGLPQYARAIHATHITSRQKMVDALHIHPNFSLSGLFDNMSLSDSILTNHYPQIVQDLQLKNLRVPTWAMMSITTKPGVGSLKDVFSSILEECTALIQSGIPFEDVIEKHPNIAALLSKDEFTRSGRLSQWAAGMVHSVHLKGDTFTCMAGMYLYWWLMRWMIHPSPETYEAMPKWLRPTPNQLFMPHVSIIDFVAWPAFREFAVEIPSLQEGMEWLIDMSKTVQCDWGFAPEDALLVDEETGYTDLCPAAKNCLHDLTNWSVGPSFRGYVSYADSYVRIRTEN